MAGEDHLDKEVSIFGELTPTSIKGGAKSRAVAAVDRLIGSAVDAMSAPLEGIARRERARQDAQVGEIVALGELKLQQLHNDPEFAERALHQHLKVTVRRQENKTETVKLAIEDLRSAPPSEEQSAGRETLDPEFLNRFERYAEDASTQEVRERWAKVLASEIRAPGTFSAKVLRIIDELDSATAQLFARVCKERIGSTLIGCLLPPLELMDQKRLVTAGLVVDPGLGMLRSSIPLKTNDGRDINFIPMERAAIAFPAGAPIGPASDPLRSSITVSDGRPSVPIIILTDEGHAISSILEGHDEESCFVRYRIKLLSDFPKLEVLEYRRGIGSNWNLINTWDPKLPDPPVPPLHPTP